MQISISNRMILFSAFLPLMTCAFICKVIFDLLAGFNYDYLSLNLAGFVLPMSKVVRGAEALIVLTSIMMVAFAWIARPEELLILWGVGGIIMFLIGMPLLVLPMPQNSVYITMNLAGLTLMCVVSAFFLIVPSIRKGPELVRPALLF